MKTHSAPTIFLSIFALSIASPTISSAAEKNPIPPSSATTPTPNTQFFIHPNVHCRFTQERHIKGLARPLKSSGELYISTTDGLLWKQEKPFQMTLVLDDERMVQIIPGHPPQIITAKQNPQLFQFNQILGKIFQGDKTALEKNFKTSFSKLPKKEPQNKTKNEKNAPQNAPQNEAKNEPKNDPQIPSKPSEKTPPKSLSAEWTLTLIPKESPLNKAFHKITLEGSSGFILHILIEDKQGDKTSLTFSNPQTP